MDAGRRALILWKIWNNYRLTIPVGIFGPTGLTGLRPPCVLRASFERSKARNTTLRSRLALNPLYDLTNQLDHRYAAARRFFSYKQLIGAKDSNKGGFNMKTEDKGGPHYLNPKQPPALRVKDPIGRLTFGRKSITDGL